MSFVTVYLRSSPDLCFERLQRRKRPEERPISLGYLQELHESYERWLLQTKTPVPVLVIDANKELDIVKQDYIRNQSYILGHSKMNSKALIQEPVEETGIV
jgi:deoxyadenosine/deoxycytidine kinase